MDLPLLLQQQDRVILSIEGPCASGKTTLANKLHCQYGGLLFHMDDYYLPKHQQTTEIAGNMDLERIQNEILRPAKDGKDIFTRKFDCKTQTYLPIQKYTPEKLIILEGSYSLHPTLFPFYTYSLWVESSWDVRKERIEKRPSPTSFFETWIPKENQYFEAFEIEKKATEHWKE